MNSSDVRNILHELYFLTEELSDAEQNAIFDYTTSLYTKINSDLRHGNPKSSQYKDIIQQIDNACK